MNFVVSATSLLKQLKSINGVLSSSNTIPILNNFLFEISPGKLTLYASDMETTVTVQLPVESKEAGSIAIPARTLLDILSNFPEQPLTFSIDKKTFGVKITADNGEYQLTGHNAEEYPRTQKLDNASTIEMKTDVLAHAIGKTLFATSSDDLRPLMCGVFCQFSENDSIFVATDAHRLVRYRRSDAKASQATSFIMPKKPLNLLKNLLTDLDDVINIEYNQTNAVFSFGNTTLTCRLIDGKYPNYDAVIPKQNPNKLTIDSEMLASALKRVSVFSNKTTHQIRFKISGSQIELSAEDLDFSNNANERLTCTYAGEDMEIGFNSKFLLDMISNMHCDEITIEMSSPNRAGIITPSKKDNPAEDVLMLVMPVMLNN
ncbi:MAG: DNA polymerase III subunit beta [Bacteroidetes bacterium]|nr:DNA polymerase III subunit beta [Bacteroidota bacterium]